MDLPSAHRTVPAAVLTLSSPQGLRTPKPLPCPIAPGPFSTSNPPWIAAPATPVRRPRTRHLRISRRPNGQSLPGVISHPLLGGMKAVSWAHCLRRIAARPDWLEAATPSCFKRSRCDAKWAMLTHG
jgi:hypothetical protein